MFSRPGIGPIVVSIVRARKVCLSTKKKKEYFVELIQKTRFSRGCATICFFASTFRFLFFAALSSCCWRTTFSFLLSLWLFLSSVLISPFLLRPKTKCFPIASQANGRWASWSLSARCSECWERSKDAPHTGSAKALLL